MKKQELLEQLLKAQQEGKLADTSIIAKVECADERALEKWGNKPDSGVVLHDTKEGTYYHADENRWVKDRSKATHWHSSRANAKLSHSHVKWVTATGEQKLAGSSKPSKLRDFKEKWFGGDGF